MALLGIYDHCTPTLAAEIAQVVSLMSLEEACQQMATRGLALNVKTVRAIAYQVASRVRLSQRLERIAFDEQLSGRRVVVSTDGGRLRVRVPSGRKTAKGRSHYHADWREPKLLIIYIVDAQGKLDHAFEPVIDGSLDDADGIFTWLAYYLRQLAITTADQLLFVADGARWIWNRVTQLIADLGLAASRVYQLVDFYHAVQHLSAIADLRPTWSAQERKAWVARQRKRLLHGLFDQVIDAIRLAFPTRLRAKVQTELDYFLTNRERMPYHTIAALKLPIGSGAIESAIRRVVNLRLKGAGCFWLRSSAEAVLLLRAFFKAGRWKLLTRWAFAPLLPSDFFPAAAA